ncbi:MAG: circularly permuted type 2 ATP-grasp protein [Gammaproteobacteria bacterium]|nr:circularly permuted type 2 ATP-grasp protein [Gammaproteobacteria bacterium]
MLENNDSYKRFFALFQQQNHTRLSGFDDFMQRQGVTFNLYKNNQFVEQTFPFDAIPRIIPADEFARLSKGLAQRVAALNAFLNDIYGEQKIIKDGIIPPDFVFGSKAYLPSFHGCAVTKQIRTHISGLDLVKDSATNEWLILEDNLRVPSGASYPLSIRRAYRQLFPQLFEQMSIIPSDHYGDRLSAMYDHVNPGGISVVLSPGRFNSAFYEHSYLARISGARLVTNEDLFVENKMLYLRSFNGKRVRVGVVYRRLDDDFLDPLSFRNDSMIGVPNLMSVYRAGNVALLNAVGNGIADDKGIYYFVPKMIGYYLGEAPLMSNAPTFLPWFESDRRYVIENLHRLVIKDVAEAGGYGVLFGDKLSQQQLSDLAAHINAEPRRFIAQERIEFYDIPTFINGKVEPRKSDLRMYIVHGEDINVWAGGLTRFAREEGNYLVNSSQGGGFKDTWVLGA